MVVDFLPFALSLAHPWASDVTHYCDEAIRCFFVSPIVDFVLSSFFFSFRECIVI